MAVEQSVAQCEADVQLRNSEVTSAQLEFDSVSHTLHILETQKAEAQKRLDEIDEMVCVDSIWIRLMFFFNFPWQFFFVLIKTSQNVVLVVLYLV